MSSCLVSTHKHLHNSTPVLSAFMNLQSARTASRQHHLKGFSQREGRSQCKGTKGSRLCSGYDTNEELVKSHLIINQQFNWIIPPFYEDNFIGLPRNSIWEGSANSRRSTWPQPQAHSESIELWQSLLDLPIQVVCAERKGDFELIRWLKCTVT